MKTLAEINAILGTETAADLTQLIGAIKAAVRDSGAGVIADLEAKLAADATAAVDAATSLAESNASELAKLTASHAEAIAAKDAQLATQDAEAWDTINAVDELTASHAEAIAELEAQHAADLAAAVEAEGRAVHNRLDALVQAGQEAHAKGDLDALGKVLVSAYAHTSKARKAKLEADLASAQAAVTAAADKLAAL